MAEDHIFGSSTPQRAHDPGLELGTGHEGLFLIWREPGQALCLSTGNQGDFLNGIVVLNQGSDQGMAHFVIGDQTLAAAIGQGTTFHAGDDAINGIINFTQTNRFLATPCREDRSFIHQVGQIGAGEPGGATRNALQRKIVFKFLVAAVHLKNRQASFDIRSIDGDLTVETTGAHQGRIENVGSVGGRNDDDSAVPLKTIHLGEQLVQGLLPFIVATADTGTTLTSDGIDLVDENQAGAVFLGFLEQVTNTAGSHANEHLHKFRTGE